MTVTNDAVVVDMPGTTLAPFKPADVAKPFVDATHGIYENVAGGVEWYFEHWVDLFEEIKAEKAAHLPKFQIADILATLPEAKVASDIPGRARLRLSQLKGQKDLCEHCAEAIRGVPGIGEVHVSPITGSILAFYDKNTFPSLQSVLAALTPGQAGNDGDA